MTTPSDPIAYYDAFAARYERRRHEGYHALIDELESSFVEAVPGGTCLEAGCGTGLILSRLRPKFGRCVGIDLSMGMLARARARGEVVARGRVERLPFADGTFDVVCCFKVLAHVPDIRGGLSELVRVTKPGGRLALQFYNRRSWRGLRWRLKLALGGENTGAGLETDLFTRYDDVESFASYLPEGVTVEGTRGAIVLTPMAFLLNLPAIGGLLGFFERRLSVGRVSDLAGFVTLVVRRPASSVEPE